MKVLRIYDHLGELKKEFNIYAVGNDFKWEASVPEVIWLGTISLEELGEPPVAERTPEVIAVVTEIKAPLGEFIDEQLAIAEAEAKEPEPVDEVELAMDKADAEAQLEEIEAKIEEVKDEPEKVHRKRSRVKRATPPASPESTERLPQNDSPGDNHKRN